MTDTRITVLPPAPLHAMELWSRPEAVAERIAAALGLALPPRNRSATGAGLTLIRVEPTVWLVEGDPAPLAPLLDEDGALTAIGGGQVRVRLSGPGWRRLLMEGGFFDAESPAFAAGCSAATVIDHVGVRLHVESADGCLAYVPASFAAALVHFWEEALPLIGN